MNPFLKAVYNAVQAVQERHAARKQEDEELLVALIENVQDMLDDYEEILTELEEKDRRIAELEDDVRAAWGRA